MCSRYAANMQLICSRYDSEMKSINIEHIYSHKFKNWICFWISSNFESVQLLNQVASCPLGHIRINSDQFRSIQIKSDQIWSNQLITSMQCRRQVLTGMQCLWQLIDCMQSLWQLIAGMQCLWQLLTTYHMHAVLLSLSSIPSLSSSQELRSACLKVQSNPPPLPNLDI